uniref:Uncharacterized protein n=1 Tax=Phocoena sinus TaxID=42100 RepID=A0A8C9E344_PHOSS
RGRSLAAPLVFSIHRLLYKIPVRVAVSYRCRSHRSPPPRPPCEFFTFLCLSCFTTIISRRFYRKGFLRLTASCPQPLIDLSRGWGWVNLLEPTSLLS